MLTLYQAEWCPYSSAARQRLTELGVDFVAKQVAPGQEDREGRHGIPILTNGDGERLQGTDAVFEFLATLAPGEWEHGTARSTAPTASTGPGRRRRECSPTRRR